LRDVSTIHNDGSLPYRGQACIYSPLGSTIASDQTNLDRWPRLPLKGSGGRICEVARDWLRPLGGRPYPLGGRLAPEPVRAPDWSKASSSLLDYFGVEVHGILSM